MSEELQRAPQPALTRRSMGRWVWITAGIVALGGQLAWMLHLLLRGTAQEPPRGPIAVGAEGDFAVGSVTHFRKERFLLARQPDGFLALSQDCTHNRCPVSYLPERQIIYCACHGAQFSTAGAVLGGPATRPLERFATEVREGQVWVDPSRRLPVS